MATPDRLSPITGLTRAEWARTADELLLALRPFASSDHSGFRLPGRTSRYGEGSDSLEAFARSFLLVAFRLVGDEGVDPHGFAESYAAGLAAGTDPASASRWPRPDELDQAKVEAASIALCLHLTRPWIWDRLDAPTRANVVAWLETVVGQEYPPINWVWFQLVVEAFLRSVDARWSAQDVAASLAVHESLYRESGWYSDGPERAYDHYVGWALHFYPLVWADMVGPGLCPPELRAAWADRLRRFLDDAVHLIGADGAPLLQGRSLIYRFAAAAPLWVGAVTGETNLPMGQIRRACSGILSYFTAHGAPDERGLLNLGLHHEWPRMAQAYSGFGSPYWAAKGFFGLVLPADHSVWTEVEQPLPVEAGPVLRTLTAPGWLVSGSSDGIVRVVNHGTDHSVPGDLRTDSPLYARLAYSTATVPPLVGDTLESARDNAVGLLDGAGRRSHRNGFEALGVGLVDGLPVGASQARAHWVDTSADDGPDHGSGRSGVVTIGPWVTTASVLRGPVEVRAVRVDPAADQRVRPAGQLDEWHPDRVDQRLELSGWPLAAGDGELPGVPAAATGEVTVTGGGLCSQLMALTAADWNGGASRDHGTSPLGDVTVTPWLSLPVALPGSDVHVIAVTLSSAGSADDARAAVPTVTGVDRAADGDLVRLTWPDGAQTSLRVPAPTTAPSIEWGCER